MATPSRRDFVTSTLGTLCGWLAAGSVGGGECLGAEGTAGLSVLDYGRSFICNTAEFNSVRFWIESRTLLTDPQGKTEIFYQCGSCKSEHTFAKENLFHKDNYDFLPVLGETGWLIFRRRSYINDNYRQLRTFDKMWGKPLVKAQETRRLTVLDSFEKIREAAAGVRPIVALTALRNPETGWKAVIEHPVKTLNVALNDKLWQTDTGPVAFPDLSRPYEPALDCLKLAFVAFNAPHFADFVIEQPTPVMEGSVEKCKIYHYSNPISLAAHNTLVALDV